MKLVILLLALGIAENTSASHTTKVYAVCHHEDSEVGRKTKTNPTQFVDFIRKEGLKSTKIATQNISCGDSIDLMGPTQPYKSSKFFSMELTDSEIAEYMKKKKQEYKGRDHEPKPPENLSQVFSTFQMSTAGACEILVPSRFDILTEENLGAASPPATPQSTSVK